MKHLLEPKEPNIWGFVLHSIPDFVFIFAINIK